MVVLNEKLRAELSKIVEDERENIIKDLCDFIRIPSVSSNHEKVMEAMDFVLNLGKKMGFAAEAKAHNQVGCIEMGEGQETLGVLTHIDVVPVEPLDQWNTNPFEPIILDGNLYGRGTLDDKGMAIASLYAMKAVKKLELPFKKKVQLIMGSQEEVNWSDMYEYVDNYELPDYGFTPDGEFPIQNIEKGICDAIFHYDFNDDLTGKLHVVSINAGSAANAVPGKATAKLSDGREIEAKGKTVHSSSPERGINALFELKKELEKLGVEENIFTKILDTMEKYYGDCIGKNLSVYKDDEYFHGEFVHRNTFAPTVFKTEGNKISVLVDVRFAYGTDAKEIIECFEKIASELDGTITVNDIMPAVFVSKEKPFIYVMAEAYENHSGLKNEYVTAFGGSYAKAMPNIVSWGPIFPGEVDTCHEPNEFIPVENLIKCTKIFAETIGEIVLQEKSFK